MEGPVEYMAVDLFCGAGGTTLGFEQSGVVRVVAAVNHDPVAIKSHWHNHPGVRHFEEDIRTLDMAPLVEYIDGLRRFNPNAKLILHGSLECTNHSNAKGGCEKEQDSRTLAWDFNRYVAALRPDMVTIENVVEFRAWGPVEPVVKHTAQGYPYCSLKYVKLMETKLDAVGLSVKDRKGRPIRKWTGKYRVTYTGRPVNRLKGTEWVRWCDSVCAMGYEQDWGVLNAADFGQATSRKRLFGAFTRPGMVNAWPAPTHAKKPTGHLLPWVPCGPLLDLTDTGTSIFTPGRIKSRATVARVLNGCVKHVAGSTMREFLLKYNSTNRDTGISNGTSLLVPCHTLSTQAREYLVQCRFIVNSNGGNPKGKSKGVDGPAGVLTTIPTGRLVYIHPYYGNSATFSSPDNPSPTIPAADVLSCIEVSFLDTGFSGPANNRPLNAPAPTLTTREKVSLVSSTFIDRQFSEGGRNSSIDGPAGAITAVPKMSLVQADRFVMPTHYANGCSGTDTPLPTITADRHWHYILNPQHGGSDRSTAQPLGVIIARQDKAPMYLIQMQCGDACIPVYEDDWEETRQLKFFMALYNISDILMRMLRVSELKRIQGFPDDYVLHGTQSDQKKGIGNSVCPLPFAAWMRAIVIANANSQQKAIAA